MEGRPIAGHSKWAQLEHIPAQQVARGGAAFNEVSRERVAAARHGGPDLQAIA